MRTRRIFLALFAIALLSGPAIFNARADANSDWAAVTALDAGPQEKPDSQASAKALVFTQLARQEKALRTFLTANPRDPRVFEAQLRLSRLLQIRSDFEDSESLRQAARRLLDEAEKSAKPEQRAEVDFAKIAYLMRALKERAGPQRDALLSNARRFAQDHPSDRRVSALLVEIATLFDAEPKIKEALLTQAQASATEEELKAQIADDLKRLRLLGTEIPLAFKSSAGREIKLSDFRGKPVVLIFFADFSPPSITMVQTLDRELGEFKRGSVIVLGVCLDNRREKLESVIKECGISWPVAFDGLGWESPLVRGLGINTLPTVWLIDKAGCLRVLNAQHSPAILVRQLLEERR